MTEYKYQLSILICTMTDRREHFNILRQCLEAQIAYFAPGKVELLWDATPYITVGAKRNKLKELAQGEYLCFVDDDDTLTMDYLISILRALESKPDLVGLFGARLYLGECPSIFQCPTHLCPLKSVIAHEFRFPDKSQGEDDEWTTIIKPWLKNIITLQGLLLYVYDFSPVDTLTQQGRWPVNPSCSKCGSHMVRKHPLGARCAKCGTKVSAYV